MTSAISSSKPFDWGVRNVRGPKNPQSVRAAAQLMQRYTPDALVVEDCRAKGRRRRERVRKLIDELTELAAANGVPVHRVSRTKVGQVFARLGATNKHRMAGVIAVRFPELAPRLPPERKPWMSEDARMAIFDAVAFALAFFSGANGSLAAPKKSAIV